MTNKKEISCKLFYSADFNIPENKKSPTPRQPQSSPDRDIAYYLEIYNNLELVLDRIMFIYNFQVEGYQNKNKDIFSNGCMWMQFYVSNKNGENMLPIGISPHGWKILSNFSYYLYTYFEKNYGEENWQKMLEQKADNTEILFPLDYTSEPYIRPVCELVSEDTSLIIIRNHLEGKELQDLDPAIYYREIEKRNYSL
ncbi:MAG: hypothetical protein QNJ72_20355 [Pleurocapsa sp. MO_226.B13]|nr:hypothetical protein [Pleurocapsa sp. MO_226.B13]